jgi:hypothetical protein
MKTNVAIPNTTKEVHNQIRLDLVCHDRLLRDMEAIQVNVVVSYHMVREQLQDKIEEKNMGCFAPRCAFMTW